jgi:hypothetical protein
MEKLIAILTFMQGINPLTTLDKSTGEEVGKKPRKTQPSAKLKGFFVLNPKPFDIAKLEQLVDAYNPSLVVRLTEPKMKDSKLIPPMVWVGQDFKEDTNEELLEFANSL